MLAGFLLALREGIEAALIISIVLGMLKKMNRYDRTPVVWLGVVGAVLLSVVAAIVLGVVGAEFEGAAEQVFEACTMLFAATVLTWMIFWMQKQGRQMQKGLEAEVREALSGGQTLALFSVAFLAVLREGIELALFLTAVNFSAPVVGAEAPILGWLGGVLGLIAAGIIGWLLYESAIKLNLRRFFQLTSIVLILFAAGLVGHALGELNELGWIPPVIEHVYDLNHLVPETTLFGQFLKALFGYNANPSLTEMLAYLGYFLVVLGLVRFFNRKPAEKSVAAA
ncbi:MAG TPA: FTR1 family protein [Anaerolineae bacterium]|nr:FTR1 family protein [Anaerolineae bacterium]